MAAHSGRPLPSGVPDGYGPLLVQSAGTRQMTGTAESTALDRPNVEQALAAFGLLRDYFEGALIVDREARITWIDQRYRDLLGLAPGFDP